METGGLASNTTVGNGGQMVVSGGHADPTQILNGGTELISAGGTDIGTVVGRGGLLLIDSGGVESGGTVKGFAVIASGGAISGTITISSGGLFELVGVDGNAVNTKFLSGGTGEIGSGAIASLNTVKGVTGIVLSGGTASGGTISAGALGVLESGGVVTSDGTGGKLTIASGGTFEYVGVNANSVASAINALPGATFELGSGATFSGAQVNSGITVAVLAGGENFGGTVISSGALVEIFAGGLVSSAVVASGGRLLVFAGGTAVDVTVQSGGTAINSGGGIFDVVSGAADFGTLVNSGQVNIADGATFTVSAAALTNGGAINLLGSTTSALLQVDANLRLSGGGKVAMTSSTQDQISIASGVTLTNVNNTILGAGIISGSGTFINSGTVSANISNGTVHLDATSTINRGTMIGISGGAVQIDNAAVNSGTLEAISGGFVAIDNSFTNSKTLEALANGQVQIHNGTIANSGGLILASAAVRKSSCKAAAAKSTAAR